MIGIFDSTLEFLTESMKKHDLPFTILADENFEYFKKYEIERSMAKTLNAMLFKPHKIIPAMMKGYIPTKIKGHLDIAVTDVLINEQGVVEEVYYAQKDIADHFEFEKIKQFALN
jgi:peroxiredoxin